MKPKQKFQICDFYKEVYILLLDKCPEDKYLRRLSDLNDTEFKYLQNFIGEHSLLQLYTNIGVMEAIEHIIETAICNENIKEVNDHGEIYWIRMF